MTSANDLVLFSVEEGIARIRLNRPDALNAIDAAMARGFATACEAVARRSDVRVVVLSGEGRAFNAGGDVRGMHEAGGDVTAMADGLLSAANPALLLLAELPVPVLASLQGAVAGGGLGIALAAVVAIAADDTKLNLAYGRIGTSPDLGTTWMLPR